MARIVLPAPPSEVAAAFLRDLPASLTDKVEKQWTVGDRPRAPALDDVRSTADQAGYDLALQVFVLEPGQGASDAAPAGWLFLAGQGLATVMGRVTTRPNAGWKLVAVSHGDRAQQMLTAFRSLDKLDRLGSAEFELRVLAVPGRYVESFWLVAGEPAQEDLVVAFPARPNHPIARRWGGQVSSLAEFLKSLSPIDSTRSRGGRKTRVVAKL